MVRGAARGRQRRRTQKITLLIRHLWQRASHLRESTLKVCSPVPCVMAHTAYLQSNYTNATSFWLISLFVGFLLFSSLF